MSVRSCHPVQSAKEHWTGSIFGSFLTACFEKGKSLSSVPIHHICSLPLPKGVIAAINRVDPFSWIGEDSCSGAKCLIVWEKASQPKCEGGLGIKGIKTNVCFSSLHINSSNAKNHLGLMAQHLRLLTGAHGSR